MDLKSLIRTITGCGANAAASMDTPSATRCTKKSRGLGYAAIASAICSRTGSSRVSKSSRALGWMPICRLMMNSSRASPTPAFGSREKAKACSGVPTFIMIFTPMSGMVASSVDSTVKSRMPS